MAGSLFDILQQVEADRMAAIGEVGPLTDSPMRMRLLGAKFKTKKPTSMLRQILSQDEEAKRALKYSTPAWMEM